MKAIEFKDVSYIYEGDEESVLALDKISFSVEEGEFIVLCGGNGSGKSTLSKLTNGLLLPDEGKVFVFGKDTATEDNAEIYEVRSSVGMVFQNPDNQMVASIIEDDVAFGPENLGVPREEIEDRITWALEVTGISGHRKKSPVKLSGGQKQRVAIAGILAMKPKVLVCDESTAMLDPEGRKEVMSVLHTLNKEQGITVIHVTHHMEECVDADRIIVLKRGKIAFDGKPDELFADSNYKLVKECYLELPILQYTVHLLREKGIDLPDGIVTGEQLAEELCRSSSKI